MVKGGERSTSIPTHRGFSGGEEDGEGWREVNVNPQLTEGSLVERKMVKDGERSTSIPNSQRVLWWRGRW